MRRTSECSLESRRDPARTPWSYSGGLPLSLGELAEVRIIDLEGDGRVDVDDRGSIEDVLEILSGLATVEIASEDFAKCTKTSKQRPSDEDGIDCGIGSFQSIDQNSKVQLAHFSVKEYLVSDRILNSEAGEFHLQDSREHGFIACSCLAYLQHHSDSGRKTLTRLVLEPFPLIEYAARSWFHHSRLWSDTDTIREVRLLNSKN